MNAMIAESAEIRFECAQCGQSIAVDISGAGVSTHCPTCEYPLTVPSLQALHDRAYGESAALAGRTAFHEDEAGEMPALRDELAEAQRRAEEAEEALADARKESARHAQRTTAAEAQLDEARAVIAELHTRLATAEETRAQWEQALAATSEKAHATETQMTARETELRTALAQSRSAAEAHAAERTALQAQLETTAAEARSAAAAAAEKFTAAQAAFDSAEAGRQSLAERCQALRTEAETLRHDLAEIPAGRELLALRDRFSTLDTEHQRTAAALTRGTAEAQALTAAAEALRTELTATRTRAAEAEHRAEAASESALKKDNEVLRGIIQRQNSVGEEHHLELRRLRRARLALRILYAALALALLGLAALAIGYFTEPHSF